MTDSRLQTRSQDDTAHEQMVKLYEPIPTDSSHGGKRPGAGRPSGSKNRRSAEIAQQAIEAGITPIEVMLTAMRDFWALGTPEAKRETALIARHAAPYIHPRLANVDQTIQERQQYVIYVPSRRKANDIKGMKGGCRERQDNRCEGPNSAAGDIETHWRLGVRRLEQHARQSIHQYALGQRWIGIGKRQMLRWSVLDPRDELEGVIAAQMIAAHSAAMECYRRAMLIEQTLEGRRENLSQANKLSRTYTLLLEA
jgi:hypothetical protein